MASEDVIELGSSDDDAEPEPKKAKTLPNVMVHIPQKLHGVTIKPAKRKTPPVLEKLATKAVTVTKIRNPTINPYANKTTNIVKVNQPQYVPMKAYTPFTNLPQINNPNFRINKAPVITQTKQSIRIQNTRTINNLPPNITIKKHPGKILRPDLVMKVRKPNPKKTITAVPTVELDDDECTTSTTVSPQWYVRPEDQTEKPDLEQENNKEPEKSQIIEITIEDSPVKPFQEKRTYGVGAELAITIDDSPIKPLPGKSPISGSDEDEHVNEKEPNSKKKLHYPNHNKIEGAKTIEIELEPIVLDMQNQNDSQEIEMSSQGEVDTQVNSTLTLPTDDSIKTKPDETVELDGPDVDIKDKEANQFHPVYQSFIDLCFKLENSDDMKKIVDKKIKAYYRQVPKDYTESEAFIDMVTSKTTAMRAGPEKMYLYIKDVVDELNLQRKMAKSQTAPPATDTASIEASNKFLYGENSEFDSKRQRQIRKLEKTLKKLHRAIQLLEEQEVDFDDEDDSVYLLTERYKERMVRVHAKFCQLTNTKLPSEPRLQIDVRPGQPAGPAKRLEKWVNKKVPIGTPLPFPDFHDVLCCVREANEEDKLGWNEADIMEQARDLFIRCGKKLQRRRQENEWRLAVSRINLNEDPAEANDDLKKKLELNKHLAAKKEIEVFNKYADRQKQLKLEAEEIGDKEANESPIESEEEDKNDECTSLLNKEKRKERLKRLLQEKSKKVTEKQEEPVTEMNEDEIKSKSKETIDTKETTSDNKENKTHNEGKSPDIPNAIDVVLSETNVYCLSDDSNQISSDIDELHLLEKLNSDREGLTSTLESSDSETPISISDTLSSGDNRKQASDVISIENSSYSESELEKVVDEVAEKPKDVFIETENTDENSSVEVGKDIQKTNNNEYSESVEDILLASSDEENVPNNKETEVRTCINLDSDSASLTCSVVDVEDSVIKRNVSVDIEPSCNSVLADGQQLHKEDNKLKNIEKESGSLRALAAVKEQELTKGSADLEKEFVTVIEPIVKGDKTPADGIDSNKVSVPVSIVEIDEADLKDGCNSEKNTISAAGPVGKEVVTNKDDINLENNIISVTNIKTKEDKTSTKDSNLEKDTISNKEIPNEDLQFVNKNPTDSDKSDKSIEESVPSNEITKNTNIINTDEEITNTICDKIISKELDSLTDEMDIETNESCNTNSNNSASKVNNVNGPINTDVNKSAINDYQMEV